MTKLINGDCLEEMKKLEDNSIDLLFCDLPYSSKKFGSCTSCAWDKPIDLELFWKEINRICKINCPMFFCCNTKFGVDLINSNPKNYRYDFCFVKSRKSGFLNSGKQVLRGHEMVYVFYRKQPVYNVKQYHKHKFLKEPDNKEIKTTLYSSNGKERTLERLSNDVVYSPPLPDSIIKETRSDDGCISLYGDEKGKKVRYKVDGKLRDQEPRYEPKLPDSVIKEDNDKNIGNVFYGFDKDKFVDMRKNTGYEPPLPDSVIRDTSNYKNDSDFYGQVNRPDFMRKNGESSYEPPLPDSVIKQDVKEEIYNLVLRNNFGCDCNLYEPPMPDSVLNIKSVGGKHQTQKPLELMDFFIKYYSNEGDLVLDPTMGSGSTGVSCKNLNRKFIGIELDEKIFNVAKKRLNI